MVVRRKKRSTRRKRTFSVNLIAVSYTHAFLDASNAGKAAQEMVGGNIKTGLETLSTAFKTNKDQMIRIGAGALAAKLVVGSLGGSKILGAVGPLKLRV